MAKELRCGQQFNSSNFKKIRKFSNQTCQRQPRYIKLKNQIAVLYVTHT